jgi:hypothetical protein
MGVKRASVIADILGAERLSGKVGSLAARLKASGGGMKEGLLNSLLNKIPMGRKRAIPPDEIAQLEKMGIMGATHYQRVIGGISFLGVGGSAISAGGIGTQDIEKYGVFKPDIGRIPAPNRGGLQGFGMGGPGGGNLAIGGVYGVDIQSKIISLNEKMVSLLEKIVVNTGADYSTGAGDESGGSGY